MKKIRVKRYQTYKEKEAFRVIVGLYGWGHVKNNGRIFLGRKRARCTHIWPGTIKGDVPCGKKLDLQNVGLYHPHEKKITCKFCGDMELMHEHFDDEVVIVIDKKPFEEQFIDKLVEMRLI